VLSSIVFASLALDPATAGLAAGITLVFTTGQDVAAGGTVSFTLPYFSGGTDDGLAVAAADITSDGTAAHTVFTAASWTRAGAAGQLVLTVAAGQTAGRLTEQTVVIAANAGIRVPPTGLTASDAAIKMLVGTASSSVVSSPAVAGGFAGVAISLLPSAATGTLPAAAGIDVTLVEVDGRSLLGEGDEFSLRPSAADCYAARYVTDATLHTAAVALDSSLKGTVNASGLAAGVYKVCYVQATLAGNAAVGVDSETGLTVTVQDAVTSVAANDEAAGVSVQAPRNGFGVTAAGASGGVAAGDEISIVKATTSCADADGSASETYSGAATVSATLTATLPFATCTAAGSPTSLGGAGGCPEVGTWRLCYIPSATGVSQETGLVVTFIQPEITITSGTIGDEVTVDAALPVFVISVTSGGVACCDGTRVFVNLLVDGTTDMWTFLYTSAGSNAVADKTATSASGAVSYTDLSVQLTGGAAFKLRFSLAGDSADTPEFLVIPRGVAVVTSLPAELTAGAGGVTALPEHFLISARDEDLRRISGITRSTHPSNFA